MQTSALGTGAAGSSRARTRSRISAISTTSSRPWTAGAGRFAAGGRRRRFTPSGAESVRGSTVRVASSRGCSSWVSSVAPAPARARSSTRWRAPMSATRATSRGRRRPPPSWWRARMSTSRGCRSTPCGLASCAATRRPWPTSCSSTARIRTRSRGRIVRPPARRSIPSRSARGRAPTTGIATCSSRCCRRATCCSSSPPRRSTNPGSSPARWRRSRRAGRSSLCRPRPREMPTSGPTGGGNSSRRASACRASSGWTASRPGAAPWRGSPPSPASPSSSPRSTRSSRDAPHGA